MEIKKLNITLDEIGYKTGRVKKKRYCEQAIQPLQIFEQILGDGILSMNINNPRGKQKGKERNVTFHRVVSSYFPLAHINDSCKRKVYVSKNKVMHKNCIKFSIH